MADIKSREARSYNMSRIKGQNTRPEDLVRKYLFSKGFRYRKNDNRYAGKPDIVLPKYHTAIFINGCFWHGHSGCKYFVWPESNADFWNKKINSNIIRDSKNNKTLEDSGWKVITIWECELKKSVFKVTMEKLVNDILSNKKQEV